MTGAISFGAAGVAGWQILKRSEQRQMAVVAQDVSIRRDTDHFREKLPAIRSAADLVQDYRTLRVALGAFGLEDDLSSKAFIRKVLEADTTDPRSLVNRLSDKRYLRLAEAFGYGTGPTGQGDLTDRIADVYMQKEFERRVGEGDDNLRLALNARGELAQFRHRESTDKTLWYEVMGNPPLRKVFEGAFGFGSSYGKLPIDRQLDEFTEASERLLGSASFKAIGSGERVDKLIRTFLAREQMKSSEVQNRYSSALTLLTMSR